MLLFLIYQAEAQELTEMFRETQSGMKKRKSYKRKEKPFIGAETNQSRRKDI